MPPEFQAGSIVAELRANIAQFEAGINAATKKLDEFEKSTGGVASGVNTAGTAIATTFTEMDRGSIKVTQKLAHFTQKLVSVQFALGSLSTLAGASSEKTQHAVESVTGGLGVFAATISVMPNQAGLIIGAIAGIGTALIGLTQKSKEAAQKIAADLETARAEFNKTWDELRALVKAPELTAQANTIMARLFPPTAVESANLAVDNMKARVADLIKVAQEAPDQLSNLQDRLNRAVQTARLNPGDENARSLQKALSDDIEALKEKFRAALLEMRDLGLDVSEAIRTGLINGADQFFDEIHSLRTGFGTGAADIQANLKLTELRSQIDEVGKAFVELSELSKRQKELKLISPLESAEADAKAAQDALQKALEIERQVEKILLRQDISPEMRKRLEELSGDPLKALDSTTLAPFLSKLREEQKRVAQERRPEDFSATFAKPFADSIGSAIVEGIQRGKGAFIDLASLGEKLFSNFLQQTVNQFQQWMTQALTAIAGAGGQILGTLFTGIAGVLGLIASRRGGVRGQEFANLSPIIESNQLVRGIVAGPTSVSIASIGDNLKRAMVGVEGRLDIMITILSQIRTANFGAGGGGGSPFAGTVPTT